MTRYRTDEEIRRYDLMKLGVLLLLLVLLALTWFATREMPTVAEVSEVTATPAGTDVTLPAPTLGATTIDAPTAPLLPGNVTLRGQAGPGAQIVILVNGLPAGAAAAGVDGAWSTTVTLPIGEYVVQAQTVDNVGAVVGESRPVELTVSADAPVGGGADLARPIYDPLTSAYQFQGATTPGAIVTLSSGDAVLGTVVADAGGAWSLTIPADAAGEVQMQVTDAGGAVIAQSAPLKLGAQPPSLDPPGELVIDPSTGAVTVPVAPGATTWAGQAEPGTAVELLVNGQSAGQAIVDATGRWSLPIELPAGSYNLQLNLLDPSGNLLAASAPFAVLAGDTVVSPGGTPAPDATGEATTPITGDATIADLLAGRPEFSTLLSVLQAVGAVGTLTEAGPFTVFAPTNEAFEALPAQVVDGLRADPQALADVLQYHITQGRYTTDNLRVVQPATLNGRLLTITPTGDTLAVNDALITTANLEAGNGLVHAIDRILVPPLAVGVRPPVIDESGVPTFSGPVLTVVGTAEPNRRLLVELNGEPFGEAAVDANGAWAVTGNVTAGEYIIIAYMLDSAGTLEAISRPVQLLVN